MSGVTTGGVIGEACGEAVLPLAEPVPGLPVGIRGWVTTRACGSFGLGDGEPVGTVMGRWSALAAELADFGVSRVASAHQVHGATVLTHEAGWHGWLRGWQADGHVTTVPGTALVVTVADCTPVLVAHPRGAIAALHAGWRGTADGILHAGLDRLEALGFPASECQLVLGPSICGPCYEVGAEVMEAVTGRPASGRGCLDVRSALEAQAASRGVGAVTRSSACTRCQPGRWFSHRGGDGGRQVAILALTAP